MNETHSDSSLVAARRRLLGLALGGGAATVVAGALPASKAPRSGQPAEVATVPPPAGSRHSDHIPT